MLLFEPHYRYAKERSRADVKTLCGFFSTDTFQLDLTMRTKRRAKVIDGYFNTCFGRNQLNGTSADLREARSQNFVAGKNFIEGSFKYRNIQCAFDAPAKCTVISRVARIFLVGSPNSLLRCRERERHVELAAIGLLMAGNLPTRVRKFDDSRHLCDLPNG